MSKRILIVDNDQDTIDILIYLLTEDGYKVTGSTSPSLLLKVSEIKPHLIILDTWVAGNFNGELCKTLSTSNEKPFFHMLLMSTHVLLPQIAADCYADGYLAKPFDICNLSTLVKMTLSS